jgi:MFS family permease
MRGTRSHWTPVIAAAALLAVTMGIRQSLGLFVAPLMDATGVTIVAISFALAVGQFTWGAAQPLAGMLADVFGPARVLAAGALLLAAGLALTPLVHSELGLILTLGFMVAVGAGAASFSIVLGAVSRVLEPARQSFASGFINAGSSFGQFVFAPLTQLLLSGAGWAPALLVLAGTAVATLPLATMFREAPGVRASARASAAQSGGLGGQLQVAMREPSYLCLHAGFFTCGFHVAFLVTHLPGEVAACGLAPVVASNAIALIGLFNIAGSLGAGYLGQRFRMKNILFWLYASRALIIGLYLVAPKTALTMYVTAAALGVSWLATVPPTAGLVGKLFGTRYLATSFGLTLLSHQIGGFLGAWLGGVVFARAGNYDSMFFADIALALLAALVNLPIREASPRLSAVAA